MHTRKGNTMIETTLKIEQFKRIETLIDWNHTATHENETALLDVAISQIPVIIDQLTTAGVPAGIIIAALNISSVSRPASSFQTKRAFMKRGYLLTVR